MRGGSSEGEALLETSTPAADRRWSPYSDIPSVYDMFAHAGTSSASTERFGEEVFENPPASAGTIPIDFPASPDYVLGPGDGLTIDLWGGVSQRLVRTVDHEGRIALPEIGPMLVNGQTLSDVQMSVQRLLRTQFRDVSADVSLSRLRTVRVYVVGDVNHPGPYDVSSLSTPLNALLSAGGPTSAGSMRIVKHYRGNTLVQQVDMYDLLLRGVRTDITPVPENRFAVERRVSIIRCHRCGKEAPYPADKITDGQDMPNIGTSRARAVGLN
jgi:protein involved in polysaccharide export with SLBB domain